MHGQRSPATRVDEPGEGQTPTTPRAARAPLLKRGGETRPPRRLRRHPSSREEGKRDRPAAFGGTPPQERRGNATTPPPSAAPLLKRGGEIRSPRNQKTPSAAFCLAMSSAIPCIASASSASICAAEKGSSSAVPWTSTKPPEPVITTFMSVSQSESSA